MKLLKYYQYIRENFDLEDLEDYFIFLHDLDLKYNIDVHWVPNFRSYSNGNYYDTTDGKFPGDDKLFIFDHEYSKGFSVYISGKVKKEEIKEFYVNFGSTINWLKSEGYENNDNLSNITPETIIDFLSVALEYPKYNQIELYNKNKFYNQIHIIHGSEAGNFGDVALDLDLYFNGPETKKITAVEMADLYQWKYQKSDDKGNVYIKVNNEDLLDRFSGSKNQWIEILNSEDIDWGHYYYDTPDFEMMGLHTSKDIAKKLRLILGSEEKYDAKLWKEFKEKYPEEYEECNEVFGDMYYNESAFQQKSDIEKSWEKYLQEYFSQIELVEGEVNQWLIKVESKWFIYDGEGDYSGFFDVLDSYLREESFSTFNPTYREYPDIDNKILEGEWLSILNKIK